MNTIRKFRVAVGLTLSVIFVAGSLIVLQSGCARKETNPAKALLAESVKKMGGEKKAAAWQTRVDKGVLTRQLPGWGTLHARCTLSVKKPDKLKLDQDYSAYDHPFFYTFYFNGGEAWFNVNLSVRQSPRYTKLLGDKMRRIDGPAYFLAQCDTFFMVPDVPDDSLFAATDISRIGVVDTGDTVYIDFDKLTKMPVRRIQDGGTTHTIMADYRDVNGLKLPFHEQVFQNGNMTDYKWEEITFGVAIDEAIFEEDRPKKD
jgi:hypothetical protein